MQKTPAPDFQILCTAINNSKIHELIHSWVPGKNELHLSPPKREILLKTMKSIQPRALFRKSLGELCAFSLLNANARLTLQGLELQQVDHTSIKTDLDEGQKNILRNYGIL